MDIQLTETSKGKPALQLEGHLYRLMKENKASRTWRCTRKDCNARVTTDLETHTFLHGMTDHNHDVDLSSSQALQFRQSCKRKAEDDITERPRKILIREAQHSKTDFLRQRDIENTRVAMWRQRRKIHPKLPTSRQETLQALTSISTKDDTCIKTDDENEIACVYSPRALEHLKNVTDMFGDGTFKSCPKYFYQIYTIISFAQGSYMPVAFFLLPGKSSNTYSAMFNMFKSLYQEVNGEDLEGKTLHLDFEKAAQNAATAQLPTVTLKGCLFHLKQNWWRKIQELGLSSEYKDAESETGRFLKMSFGLPFLDFLDVYESFAFDVLFEAPSDDKLDCFLTYLMETYICSNSTFPPTLWASSDMETKRTTNGCEAFHRKLNSLFYTSHPSIFELLARLQELLFENAFKRNDGPARPLALRDRKKQDWMRATVSQYREGSIGTGPFLRKICTGALPNTNL